MRKIKDFCLGWPDIRDLGRRVIIANNREGGVYLFSFWGGFTILVFVTEFCCRAFILFRMFKEKGLWIYGHNAQRMKDLSFCTLNGI